MSRKNTVEIKNNNIKDLNEKNEDVKPKPKRGRPRKIVVNDVVLIKKDVVEVDINSNQTTVSTKESKRKKLDDETDKVKLITEVNLKKLTSQMENDAKEVKFKNIFFCLNSMN